jgi:hypothetical protein
MIFCRWDELSKFSRPVHHAPKTAGVAREHPCDPEDLVVNGFWQNTPKESNSNPTQVIPKTHVGVPALVTPIPFIVLVLEIILASL